MTTLKEATDARLLIIASIEHMENMPFSILIAHNGSEIVDEIITPYESAEKTLLNINELVLQYGRFTKGLAEIWTDNKDLIRLAATIAGYLARPKRKPELAAFTRRTIESYMRDEIFNEEPSEPETQKKRSKLRIWLINVLQKCINYLQGER